MTLDHKTSHKGQFFEIYISSIDVSFLLMYSLLGSDNIWLQYNYMNIWNLSMQKI